MLNIDLGRRGLLAATICIAIGVGAWWFYQAQKPVSTVPVIIYLVDTLRADRLGVYGYTLRPTSPVIDALAAESVVFDQAYGPAPWTPASVASLMTSTFLCQHGVFSERDRLNPDYETLAERLGRIGYLTLATYANPYFSATWLNQGFQVDEFQGRPDYLATGKSLMEQRMTRRLDELSDDPFFWYVHTVEPHDLDLIPTSDTLKFGHVSIDDRVAFRASKTEYDLTVGYDWKNELPRGTSDQSARWQPAMDGLRERRETIDLLYDASVSWADTNLGELVEQLKRKGTWDRAVFIFLSDHGEELDDHDGWFHEQSVYEELVRVPLIIHFPGGEFGGRRVAGLASLVDIMPTIFDYLGRPDLCGDCRGSSLMPRVRQPGGLKEEQPSIVAMRDDRRLYDPHWASVRGNRNVVVRHNEWKGIWNADTLLLELYDLASDPGEQLDLSAENPALADEFRTRAQQWLEACAANRLNPVEGQQLDEATKEQLRALGYL